MKHQRITAAASWSERLDQARNTVTERDTLMEIAAIYTDHATGCQYLRVRGGNLVPRLGVDGKPVCKATHTGDPS